jgi:hypothetical protein
MNWASVSPTVLPLCGVVLGAGFALIGQYSGLRADVRKDESRAASERRAERKGAIIDFLSAAERIEPHRWAMSGQEHRDAEQLTELLHAVWLAKKVIELVCSSELAQAAHDYTQELNHRSREFAHSSGAYEESVGLFDRERLLRAAFMEAARREMGYTGRPLKRRKRAGDEEQSEAVAS